MTNTTNKSHTANTTDSPISKYPNTFSGSDLKPLRQQLLVWVLAGKTTSEMLTELRRHAEPPLFWEKEYSKWFMKNERIMTTADISCALRRMLQEHDGTGMIDGIMLPEKLKGWLVEKDGGIEFLVPEEAWK